MTSRQHISLNFFLDKKKADVFETIFQQPRCTRLVFTRAKHRSNTFGGHESKVRKGSFIYHVVRFSEILVPLVVKRGHLANPPQKTMKKS